MTREEKHKIRINDGDTERESRIKERIADDLYKRIRHKNQIKIDFPDEEQAWCDLCYRILDEVIDIETYAPKPDWAGIESRNYYFNCYCDNYKEKHVRIFCIYQKV